MEFYGIYLPVFATIMLTSFVSARAVNISNTWMLPEEGFPVFYRYFRDRISWYEADAVCQFHHANLVTADSTSQYDAIRAYLKELDITENIWIGLSKAAERPNFTWTNFQSLNGEGHWQQPIPKTTEAICVGMDPVADFLWKPMTCGGPDVASFICELPVPSWALGPKGCLLTELPSLTVLYIPEQMALELTSDCGFDGTKRIACKGDADREEILKQLSCAMSPDDFEDKSTKPPVLSNTISNAASDMSSDDLFVNGKTTKPWIWTSNTIDIDYGMPTRHRRETEDTLSPSSTRSTTDLSTSEAEDKTKSTSILSSLSYETETTSFTPEEDVTLDMIVSLKPEKTKAIKSEFTTESANEEMEEQAEVIGSTFTINESKSVEPEVEDTGEYPSAIGQGQLFSIIENGTMFDIIEVNETTSDDSKLSKEVIVETPQSETETSKPTTIHNNDNLYTTVVYHKEPPLDANFVTNKSVKKMDKQPKKHLLKEKDPKKLNQQIMDKAAYIKNSVRDNNSSKILSKEVEMYPVFTDSHIKLNRTFRKELPPNEEPLEEDLSMNNTNNVSSSNKHQHVEIKWHQEENNNLLPMKLVVTTKRSESVKKSSVASKENIELMTSTEDDETFHAIDSKIDILNKDSNLTTNNHTEFVTSKPEKIQMVAEESDLMKEQFLPKSLIGDIKNKVGVTSESSTSSETVEVEPEPEAQPRPNRQRQLTRPQRRSFYPYFFSRVLG